MKETQKAVVSNTSGVSVTRGDVMRHGSLATKMQSVIKRFIRDEDGQTTVEYMLGIAVVVIGMSMIFVYMSNSTRDIFSNARRMIELPYP